MADTEDNASNKRGLLRVTINSEFQWFHVNPNPNTQKLRLRPIPPIPLNNYDTCQEKEVSEIEKANSQFFTLDEVSKHTGLPVRSFSIQELSAWTFVAERMESRINLTHQAIKVIPITPIRNLYQWLRERPSQVEKEFLHQSLADSFNENPEKLASLIVDSYKVFLPFNNPDERFVPERDDSRFKNSKYTGTNGVVKFLQENGSIWKLNHNKLDLDFKVVDREIGPRRATSENGLWYYDNGSPASNSGAGGIDILMTTLDDNPSKVVPIVGEIKVKNDETPFSALIQCLTYAIELSTPNQLERLKNSYQDHFAQLDKSSRVDVYIIMKQPDPNHKSILDSTVELAKAILERNSGNSFPIRRIAFLEVKPDDLVCPIICRGAFQSRGSVQLSI